MHSNFDCEQMLVLNQYRKTENLSVCCSVLLSKTILELRSPKWIKCLGVEMCYCLVGAAVEGQKLTMLLIYYL